ncbi:hypothetical protein INH39_03625 [Massilia violaceinigra]|uniref:Transmembrane protein n=1 Tax=Massilia violaceinigra TaxID=2045208 RepID=A0ABY4A838_9BURK|nr:hypothetical protein [Massilia violaceinigra]UOD30838.1 hypothetical protein INH39_03625 [Massilia violaceinigra]
MTRPKRTRSRLLAPLLYLAALILLLEEWLWDSGKRLGAVIAGWPLVRGLDARIRALPPYAALCAFVLPAILLFPVKLLALLAIADGHVVTGVLAMVLAKIGGAAAVTRLYALTLPSLLTLAWFARWHGVFMAFKDKWVGALKATLAYRRTSRSVLGLRARWRRAIAARRRRAKGGRHSLRPTRILRRFAARWRARRR